MAISGAKRRKSWGLLQALIVLFVSCHTSGGPPSPLPPVAATCGNGAVEGSEECDDGNLNNADACLTTCQRRITWFSGDVHLHTTGCDRDVDSDAVASRMRAQGLQVGAVLVWGKGYGDDAPLFTGRDYPQPDPGLILHYDLEVSRFAASRTGHLVLLGLDSINFSDDMFGRPTSGVPITDWARRQPRAVIGMAHTSLWPDGGSFPTPPGGCCTPWEIVVDAVRGRLDFLSFERVSPGQGAVDGGTFRLWKAIQNAGFRVAIAGGSDWLCTHQLDDETPRTDVIVDGPLTYDKWLDAIKSGRTAVANANGPGDRLNLRVEGILLGGELRVSQPQAATVTLESTGAAATDVEILVNGEVVARISMAPGVQVAQTKVLVSKSSWVVARSGHVLTSPVYVVVDSKPIRASPDDICYLWRSVENLKDLVSNGDVQLGDGRSEALAAYDEATSELRRRFMESGGSLCH